VAAGESTPSSYIYGEESIDVIYELSELERRVRKVFLVGDQTGFYVET
jgi:hypothetical protein